MCTLNMKDKEIVINQWVDLYSEPLLKRAIFLLENRDDAKDLVQEVFVSAVQAYHHFKEESTPLTWLQTILKNKVADFYREKYRNTKSINIVNFFDSKTGSWTDNSILNDWDQNLNEQENQNSLHSTLDKCIEDLPAQWLLVVKLYYLKEKKNNEVCSELNISLNNLWKILQRSRMQLRKCIELNWFEKL